MHRVMAVYVPFGLCAARIRGVRAASIGSDTEIGVNDADYKLPFPLTAELNKLTIVVNRPQMSPEDIKKLETATRNNKMAE